MRVFSVEIPPATRELHKSQNPRDWWVMEISIRNCYRQPQRFPINHCKINLGSLSYSKVMAQPFLNATGRAVMSKAMQHHSSLQVIYAHQTPATCQGTTPWIKVVCKTLCSTNKSEWDLGLKTWFTGSLTPRSNKISFAPCRNTPPSNTLTHTLAQRHPHQARQPPACVCMKITKEQLCSHLLDLLASS